MMKQCMECPICMVDDPPRPRKTVCGHTFCSNCIVRWNEIKQTCPTCRTTLLLEPKSSDGEAHIQVQTKQALGVTTTNVSPQRKVITSFMCCLTPRVENGGVRILRVAPNGMAHAAGLRAGDIVISINGLRVKTHTHFASLIIEARNRNVPLHIRSNRVVCTPPSVAIFGWIGLYQMCHFRSSVDYTVDEAEQDDDGLSSSSSSSASNEYDI